MPMLRRTGACVELSTNRRRLQVWPCDYRTDHPARANLLLRGQVLKRSRVVPAVARARAPSHAERDDRPELSK